MTFVWPAHSDGIAPARSGVPGHGHRLHRILRPLLILLALITFVPVVTCGFTNWDDPYTVAKAPELNPPTWASLGKFWTHADMDIYMPLTQTVWAAVALVARVPQADSAGAQLNPHLFHVLNLLVHLGSVLAVYSILGLLTGHELAAWFGAAVFAVHPVMVEPVAWVSGLKDVLCGALSLWALRLWLAPLGKVDWPRLRWAAATLLYALALLAKPSAVVLPLIAAALGLMVLRQSAGKMVARLLPWVAMAIPIGFIAQQVQPAVSVPFVPIYLRPLIAADAIVFYLGKLFWPAQLGIDYGHTPQAVLASSHAKLALGLVLLIALVLFGLRRRLPLMVTAAGVFVMALLPVLGLMPFDFQEFSTVADHYLYVAMLGPALGVAVIIARWPGRLIETIGVIVVMMLAARSAVQVHVWSNPIALMSHAVEVNPDSWMGHMNLGWALSTCSPQEAARELQMASRLRPEAWQIYQALGEACLQAQRPQEAVRAFKSCVGLMPSEAAAWHGLGRALDAVGRQSDAIAAYRRAMMLNPRSAAIRVDLAADLAEAGRLSDAIALYRGALRIDPQFAAARAGLARALAESQPVTRE